MDNKKTQSKKLSPEQQKEIEGFKKWLADNNYNPKDEKEVAQLYKQYKSQQTKKALHGAKLNYFRSLKNQCPEGQELVYFRKGGSVTCGCKKKENGGEVTKAQEGWKSNFKNRKKNEQPTMKKCGGAVKKEASGSKVVKTFKDKCGAKMKKK